MKYFINKKNDKIESISTGSGEIEITESEYNRLLDEIMTKAKLVDDICDGNSTVTIPTEWQEEIQHRVEERKRRNNINKNTSEVEQKAHAYDVMTGRTK